MLLHAKDKDDSGNETEVNPRVYNEADEKRMRRPSKTRMRVPDYESHLSEFDDYVVASEKLSCKVSKYKFEMGEMVWGKVKSHPWWPGYIFNEAFVSPSVRSMKKIGYVLVAFFGDCSYGWFDPCDVIPFEPHLEEKSKQTSSSNFVKAVEEAMEEMGKRSALGLTCKCRNPLNFGTSNVQGYSVVDVVGYELQAVYSSKQIKKARDGFSCVETLSFVKRCALGASECDSTESLKFCQRKATVYAFRRAVFEEFDETYKQAFGAISGYSPVKTEEVINRVPPRAPLSGSLVIGEARGDTKSSVMKVMDSTKPEKYLPRRKEEAGDVTVQFGQVQASSQLQGINGASTEDYLLQRKTPCLQSPMKHEQTGLVSMEFTSSSGDISGNESYVSKFSPDDKGLAQESKVGIEGKAAQVSENEKCEAMASLKQEDIGMHSRLNKGPHQPFIDRKCSAGVGLKKGNVLKRSSEKLDSEKVPKRKKKKEPWSELNRESSDKRKASSTGDAWAKKSLQLGSAERHLNVSIRRNSKLDVLQLLNNLQALSLGPFFGSLDKSSVRAVRQFFLRFRSLVYHQSLASSPPPPTKPAESLSSTNKPSKAGETRLSPYPQQDIPSTKKLKKTSQFRPMSSYKKTNQEAKKISSLAPLNPVRDQGGQVPKPVKTLAPSAKVIEPTMLVMKFPSGSSLPSLHLLKARFSRFGLLDKSATRVFWKSSSCRVVFLYKLDAQTAYRYVSGSNSLFGSVNVAYSLLDMKAASASRDHKKKKAKTEEPLMESLSQRLEQTPPIEQPNIQLKSCLKKPLNSSNGSRRKTRVKFRLDNSQYSRTKPVKNQVDISEQMMKLLLECNDVVANVTSLLGYAPYHSL